MSVVRLKCGIVFHSEEIAKLLDASPDQVDWQEIPILQHGGIEDVEQVMIRPCKIAGVSVPQEPIAYGVRTSVIQGDEAGRTLFTVESSGDFLVAGRFNYSFTERKTLMAESVREMEDLVLSEFKRFLHNNL
jgi:hypothetical protein